MDIPVELADGTEPTDPDDAPEETKATFWDGVGEFVSALLWSLP